jgi:hypothetical protein
MCLVIAGDNCHVIAVAKIDSLNIGYRDVVVAGSKRQRINTVAKVDSQAILSRIEDQRLISRAAD